MKAIWNKTLVHFSSLTFSPWMFHHESEKKNENLETQWLCSKNPPPKAEKNTTRKTTTTRIHFLFVQVGRDLSIIFFCLASKSWDFTKDREENEGKTRARNPQPHNQGISELVQPDPPPASRTKRIPHLVPVEGGDGRTTPSKTLS